MNFQEQINTIQAAKDGRVVTRTVTKSGNTYRVPTGHFFDFIHNTYTIEPMYREREVIMVKSSRGWEPRIFIEMVSEGALCYVEAGYPYVCYTSHRKQNATDKGEA